MKNIWNITLFTVREAFSKKLFLTFLSVSSFVIVVAGIVFASFEIEQLAGFADLNGKPQGELLERVVGVFRLLIITPLFGGGLFLSIFSVSSFIPNMLEKGNIDLFLSKPITRQQIIWGKFLGGLIVVFINIAYVVIGFWMLLGFKFGVWDINFLVTIPTITFTFAVLYALIILLGILTKSSILAMMVSYLIFFILSPVLAVRDSISALFDNKFVELLFEIFYHIIPKTAELGSITSDLAAGGGIIEWQPIITSIVFMFLILGLSIIIFNKKDY